MLTRLSPASTLLRNHPTSLSTSHRYRCLHSELPCHQGSKEISWSKTMHFPVFLSSIPNEPLGKLGVVFRSTQTRFILPYEISLSFRNPFRFQLPPQRTSRSCSCLQLVVTFRRPHSGLSPPSSSSCPTHSARSTRYRLRLRSRYAPTASGGALSSPNCTEGGAEAHIVVSKARVEPEPIG